MRSLIILLGSLALISCDAAMRKPTGDNPNNNGGNQNGMMGTGNPNCGVQNFKLEKALPPEVLIVLDRSGSMDEKPEGSPTDKWTQVGGAVQTTVSQLQNQLKWGLELFPGMDNGCSISPTVDVPVDLMNGSAIASAITSHSPGGETPTAKAIQTGAAYLAGVNDGHPKYILLATDGDPNCGTTCSCSGGSVMMNGQCCLMGFCFPCIPGPDEAGAAQAVSDAANQGIHTFVVGISVDSWTDSTLNLLADKGMEPRPGTTKYYPVGSEADLLQAIQTIASQVTSCSFALAMAPPDPNLVSVNLAGSMVPRDQNHKDGWDFGPGNQSIRFFGSWCGTLQMSVGSSVEAIYGCPVF